MAKAQRTRAYGGNLTRDGIIKVLEKAGWEARPAHGSHIMMSKTGQPSLTLPMHLSQNVISNVQRVVGVEMEQFATGKQGKPVTQAEIIKRLTQGRTLYEAGFSPFFITKHLKLANFISKTGFDYRLYDSLNDEEIFIRYAKPWLDKNHEMTHRGRVTSNKKPSKLIGLQPTVSNGHATPEPAVIEHIQRVAQPAGNEDALLTLMGEMNDRLEAIGKTRDLTILGLQAKRVAEAQKTLADEVERLVRMLGD